MIIGYLLAVKLSSTRTEIQSQDLLAPKLLCLTRSTGCFNSYSKVQNNLLYLVIREARLSSSFSKIKGVRLKKITFQGDISSRAPHDETMTQFISSTSRSSKVPGCLIHCSTASHKGSPVHPMLPKMDNIPGFSNIS